MKKGLQITIKILIALVLIPVGIIIGLLGFFGLLIATVKIPFRSDVETDRFKKKLTAISQILHNENLDIVIDDIEKEHINDLFEEEYIEEEVNNE